MKKLYFIMLILIIGCSKEDTTPLCVDYDGNVYKTVQIGDQLWMAENLRVAHDSAGGKIPYCHGLDTLYGDYYSYYAVTVAIPKGWRIPTETDILKLVAYLGDGAGGKLKQAGTKTWEGPNVGATNSTGFTAIPAGYKQILNYNSGAYSYSIYGRGNYSNMWMIKEGNYCVFSISYTSDAVIVGSNATGLNSVRCIKK